MITKLTSKLPAYENKYRMGQMLNFSLSFDAALTPYGSLFVFIYDNYKGKVQKLQLGSPVHYRISVHMDN
jgi:hypothetical protein